MMCGRQVAITAHLNFLTILSCTRLKSGLYGMYRRIVMTSVRINPCCQIRAKKGEKKQQTLEWINNCTPMPVTSFAGCTPYSIPRSLQMLTPAEIFLLRMHMHALYIWKLTSAYKGFLPHFSHIPWVCLRGVDQRTSKSESNWS